MLEVFIGAVVGAVAATFVHQKRLRELEDEKTFVEAKYNSLKGFFDARVLAVKAKADEAKKRA